MAGFLKDFKDFIRRGNVVDLAVAVVLGVAIGAVVKSLVDDVIMPPVGLLLGGADFSDLFVTLRPGSAPADTLEEARSVGAVTLNYGAFINSVVAFLIIALAVYLIVRALNRLMPREAQAAETPTRDCPYCLSSVPAAAVRCPACTSELHPTVSGGPETLPPRPRAPA